MSTFDRCRYCGNTRDAHPLAGCEQWMFPVFADTDPIGEALIAQSVYMAEQERDALRGDMATLIGGLEPVGWRCIEQGCMHPPTTSAFYIDGQAFAEPVYRISQAAAALIKKHAANGSGAGHAGASGVPTTEAGRR